jgi:hypothetical protein
MPRTLDPWTPDRWTGGRPVIGLRWHITRSGELLVGWPAPGLETTVLSMGWMTDDARVGIVEFPASPIDIGVLEILEERFPGRRWFAGSCEAEPGTPTRQAA